MRRCNRSNRLNLAFGKLHDELLNRCSSTAYDALHAFIETPIEASQGACSHASDLIRKQVDLPRAVHAAPAVGSRCVRQISCIIEYVTYYHHQASPHPLPQVEDQLVELVCWRMKYTPQDHMILMGFQHRGVIVLGAAFERMLAARDRFGDVATSEATPVIVQHISALYAGDH